MASEARRPELKSWFDPIITKLNLRYQASAVPSVDQVEAPTRPALYEIPKILAHQKFKGNINPTNYSQFRSDLEANTQLLGVPASTLRDVEKGIATYSTSFGAFLRAIVFSTTDDKFVRDSFLSTSTDGVLILRKLHERCSKPDDVAIQQVFSLLMAPCAGATIAAVEKHKSDFLSRRETLEIMLRRPFPDKLLVSMFLKSLPPDLNEIVNLVHVRQSSLQDLEAEFN
ncbi:Hypothetical Protein FCC1311_091852, partial [Hondaea fermentalgiana]